MTLSVAMTLSDATPKAGPMKAGTEMLGLTERKVLLRERWGETARQAADGRTPTKPASDRGLVSPIGKEPLQPTVRRHRPELKMG